MNRLADESSPYLLLHKNNPVDWYPWGPEALARAQAEEKPIFLSVGYSTCYWCHVMERESFTDPVIAELMNESFVNIKVDREERPDLDEIYMVATQVLAGQGGWPNSVFLTPELKPYFAGTYFPPRDAHGRPGFPTVLSSMRDAWAERRADASEQAESVAGAIRHYLEEQAAPTVEAPGPGLAHSVVQDLQRRFDPTWGGFGGAPKFPTPSNLMLLHELAPDTPLAAEMLTTTLDQMARGGIYDQLGGGFHRYATDREWKIPHFEKMLYDNAWLLEIYARHHQRTGDPEAARIVRETAGFIERELTSPEGGFWSALDAETDGHEGAFYVWDEPALETALSTEDRALLGPIYGFDGAAFFEGQYWVLHLPVPLADQAARRRTTVPELLAELEPLRTRLFEVRAQRPALSTDDKVLADWNGMAIAGLATAGELLDEPELVARAARAARFVLERMRAEDGVLLHAWRAGQGKVPALLGDYAHMVRGLLALGRATGEPEWQTAAIELTEEQITRLADPIGGFFVAAESDDVLVRSKEIFDGAVPGTNSVAILNLIELADATGDERWRGLAEAGLKAFGTVAGERPSAAVTLTIAARRFAGEITGAESPTSARDNESSGRVQARLAAELEKGVGEFRLELAIDEGWHIYAGGPDNQGAAATTLEIVGGEIEQAHWPPSLTWQPSNELPAAEVYQRRVMVTGSLSKVREGARLRVTFQPCNDERCLLPETIELKL